MPCPCARNRLADSIQEELERLNKKRAEREIEQQLREEEDARNARLAESALMDEWIAKEDDFQLEQARRRAGIRMKENRAKAIDFLAINLRFAQPWQPEDQKEGEDDGWGWDDAGLEMDIEEPYKIFEVRSWPRSASSRPTADRLLDLLARFSLEPHAGRHRGADGRHPPLPDAREDPVKHRVLEGASLYCSRTKRHLARPLTVSDTSSQAMRTVCKARLRELSVSEVDRINPHVEAEISNLLSGKTLTQLEQLEISVRLKLESGEPVDTDYWEALLGQLEVWKARADLHAMHEVVLQNRLEQLRLRQREDAARVQSDVAALVNPMATAGEPEDLEDIEEEDIEEELVEQWSPDMEAPLVDAAKLSYEDKAVPQVSERDELRKLVRRFWLALIRLLSD
jgi:hypothetical protein